MSALSGKFDATYHTVQRDMFTSGLAAHIGAAALEGIPRRAGA